MNAGPTGDDRIALSNELINFPSRSYSSSLDRCARQKHLRTRLLNASQVYKIIRRIYGRPLPLYSWPLHWDAATSISCITLWSRVIHEKLSLLTCSRNSPSVTEPTVQYLVTRSCHRFLPWPSWIHSTSVSSIQLLPNGLLPSGFPIKMFNKFIIFLCLLPVPPSHHPWFDHPNNIWWRV
jgi:hypothetical protein